MLRGSSLLPSMWPLYTPTWFVLDIPYTAPNNDNDINNISITSRDSRPLGRRELFLSAEKQFPVKDFFQIDRQAEILSHYRVGYRIKIEA